MPPFTKRAIVDSFLKIAAKKPFDKITVRDVVDDCGVNRNTFYYYFQDIYGVVEYLCDSESEKLPEDASIRDSFLHLCHFTMQHRRAIQNIYASLGSDGMTEYLFRVLDRRILSSLRQNTGDKSFTPEEEKNLTACIRYAMMGFYTDWLKNDCRETPEEKVACLSYLFHDVFPFLVEKSKNQTKN